MKADRQGRSARRRAHPRAEALEARALLAALVEATDPAAVPPPAEVTTLPAEQAPVAPVEGEAAVPGSSGEGMAGSAGTPTQYEVVLQLVLDREPVFYLGDAYRGEPATPAETEDPVALDTSVEPTVPDGGTDGPLDPRIYETAGPVSVPTQKPGWRMQEIRNAWQALSRRTWLASARPLASRPGTPVPAGNTTPTASPQEAPKPAPAPVPTPRPLAPQPVVTMPNPDSPRVPVATTPPVANLPERTPPRLLDATIKRGARGWAYVLRFSEPLAAAAAGDAASYRVEQLTPPDWKLSTAPGDMKIQVHYPRTAVPLAAAHYDAATATVTLMPRGAIRPGSYFAVSSTAAETGKTPLADTAGNALDGNGDGESDGRLLAFASRMPQRLAPPARRPGGRA